MLFELLQHGNNYLGRFTCYIAKAFNATLAYTFCINPNYLISKVFARQFLVLSLKLTCAHPKSNITIEQHQVHRVCFGFKTKMKAQTR